MADPTATTTGSTRRFQPCSDAFLAIEALSRRQLELTLVRGRTPDSGTLAGWEFRGANATPLARLGGVKKFIKGFFRVGGAVHGYNLPVTQNRLDGPWIPKPRRPGPGEGRVRPARRFGFFQVERVDPTSRDSAYLHALLLDYDQGKTGPLDPLRGIRDYVVQVDPDNPDLFLGKAYYRLGPRAIAANFFVLERYREIDDDRR